MRSLVRWSAVLLTVTSTAAAAQNTIRWNDVVRSLDDASQDPPVITLSLDRRIANYGDFVRVGFQTEEDAFVVVARVDARGVLTVLFPSGRGVSPWTKAGEQRIINGARVGGLGTFQAVGMIGESGYVFAIASRRPIDFSRLQNRDFSAWVTGIARGQPNDRYIGDPHRVIQRFARLVLDQPDAEDWDYDIGFYSVSEPTYVTSSYASTYCRRYGPGSTYSSYDYDSYYGYGTGFGNPCANWYNTSCYGYGFSSFYGSPFGMPWYCGQRSQQVATNDPGPVQPPYTADSVRVNGWAPDSISRPWVDMGTRDDLRRPGALDSRPGEFTRDPVRDRGVSDDQSYAIPSHALDALRGRRDRERGSATGASSPPVRSGTVAETRPLDWSRTPRAFETGSNPEGLSRGSLVRRGSGESAPTRSGGISRWDAPVRTASPIFDRGGMPDRVAGNAGFDRSPYRGATGGNAYSPPYRPATGYSNGGGPGYSQPDRSGLSSPSSSGSGGVSPGSSSPPATESRGGVESRPVTGGSGSSSGEKKPPQQ